jgi:hypothetical protein
MHARRIAQPHKSVRADGSVSPLGNTLATARLDSDTGYVRAAQAAQQGGGQSFHC